MKRLLFILELLFLTTFWWQTRINALQWWPDLAVLSSSIDYTIPFIYLSDILFGFVLLGWAINLRFRTSNFRFTRVINAHWFWPAIWFGLLLVAGFISIKLNGVGIWGWYRWLKLVEGALLVLWIVGRWGDDRRRCYVLVLTAGLILEAIIMIGEWLTGASLGWQWLGEWIFDVHTIGIAKVLLDGQAYVRPMGTFAHANIAAAVLVVSIPLVWWSMKRLSLQNFKFMGWVLVSGVRQRLETSIKWGCLGLMLVAIGLSFSRAAWVIGGVYALLAVIYRWNEMGIGRLKNMGRSFNTLKVWIIGGVIMTLIVGPVVWSRFMSLITTDSWSVSLRWQLAKIAWRMWMDHPWGVGLNNFTVELARNMNDYNLTWWQPVHNVWLLILAEMGWVGLLSMVGLMVIIVGWLAIELWRHRSGVSMGVWLLSIVWLGVISLSMIDHYWWTNQQASLAVWGLMGGTWLYREKMSRE